MTETRQGIVHATLVASDLAVTCDAYLAQLSLTLATQSTLGDEDAAVLGLPDLAGAPMAWLANAAGEPVLRVSRRARMDRVSYVLRYGQDQ